MTDQWCWVVLLFLPGIVLLVLVLLGLVMIGIGFWIQISIKTT